MHRGYMYDKETGLYYLNSRYYDPQTCRFVNADALVLSDQTFDGNNLFVYCINNPVNLADYTGTSTERIRELEAQLQAMRVDMANNINTKYNLKDAYSLRSEIDQLKAEEASKPFWKNFQNSDGSLAFYDSKRFHPDRVFHEQILALNGGAGFDLLNGDCGIQGDITLFTGGWETDYVDISLFDFAKASAGIGVIDNFWGVEAMATAWAPSITVTIFSHDVTVEFDVGSIGGKYSSGNGGFSIGGSYLFGGTLTIN